MQIIRTGIVDKFNCYSIYALVNPFIDTQPVNWLKLFAGYIMSFVQLQAKPNTLILCNLYFLFKFFIEVTILCTARIIKNLAGYWHCIAFCVVLVIEIYFYGKEILASHFVLFNAFKAIGSSHIGSTQSFIQNTTKIFNSRMLFYFYIFIFYI